MPRKAAAVTVADGAVGVDAALLAKYKDFAGLAVIERRLQDPELPGSIAIRLKDEPTYLQDPQGKKRIWYLRWINAAEAGRFALVTDTMGYVPVRVEELQSAESVMGLAESKDGIVRRGDRGAEVLVKMPLELYTRIKQAQEHRRTARARNVKAVREDLANIAGRQLGSEAGDAVNDDFTVEVKRGRRTTIARELGDED
jgi:hypothetical protein